jgi:hypothetical protein
MKCILLTGDLNFHLQRSYSAEISYLILIAGIYYGCGMKVIDTQDTLMKCKMSENIPVVTRTSVEWQEILSEVSYNHYIYEVC